jgi:hypothetical protein
MTLKIKIWCSWANSTQMKEFFERFNNSDQFPEYGKDKKVYFTDEGEEYTHVLLINTHMPNISHIPKENVIGIAAEPIQFLGLTQTFIDYAKKYIGKYYVGDIFNLPEPFVEHNSYMGHIRKPASIPEKKKVMSIMISQKKYAPGHKYRHDIVNRILQSKLPIDIYGKGCPFYKNKADARIKGEFNDEAVMFESYQFHIAIENYVTKHYFSEKIGSPLMLGTNPIYLGCLNIDTYFPKMVIKLTGNIDDDMQLITAICNNPDNYYKPVDLQTIDANINIIKDLIEHKIF